MALETVSVAMIQEMPEHLSGHFLYTNSLYNYSVKFLKSIITSFIVTK